MLIKKQNEKKLATNLVKLNKLKQQCYLRTQIFNQNSTFYTKDTSILPQKIQLTIALSSYAISQVKDISYSVVAIEKLIYYLNSVCAKQLRTTLDVSTINPIVSQKQTEQFVPAVLGGLTANYTYLLHCQKILLLRLKKQQYNYKVIKHCNNASMPKRRAPSQLTNNVKKNNHLIKTLEHSYYFDRWFFKLSKEFSNVSAISKRLVQRRNSKNRFTVIRAPFVFKKTREQFCLQRLSSHVIITFASSAQKHFLIQNLRLLKLPTELKLITRE